jgi:hypothetical protein
MLFAYMTEQPGQLCRTRNVSDKIVTLDFAGDFLGVFFVARMHYNLRALASEGARDAQSNVMGGSGNE